MTPGQGRDAPRDRKRKRTSDLGRRLTSARIAAGLSQHGLAEILGVSDQSVMAWETGRARPRALARIALEDAIADRFARLRAAHAAKRARRH